MTFDLNEAWALLWSHSQNALHIEHLGDMQQTNAQAFAGNHPVDYVLMGVGTREQCEAGARRLQPILAQRELGIDGPRSIADGVQRLAH